MKPKQNEYQGISRFKPWNHDPSKLVVGIEQEHFVFKQGRAPTREEMHEVFRELTVHGFSSRKTDSAGRPLQVNRDVGTGYVAIKNDYCTHIIEAALPASSDPEELREVYVDTWSCINEVLARHDMHIHYGAILSSLPDPLHLMPNERLEWQLNRPLPPGDSPFKNRHFAALITATQTHFNILEPSFYPMLTNLYNLDYLVPLLYSNSGMKENGAPYCARPLVYRANYSQSYLASCIPTTIPKTEAEYQDLITKSEDFVRDYSYIAPRSFGSVEFRLACSQNSVDDILELSALRMAIIIAAHNGSVIPRDPATILNELSWTGDVPNELLADDVDRIIEATEKAPKKWTRYLETVLHKLQLEIHESRRSSA